MSRSIVAAGMLVALAGPSLGCQKLMDFVRGRSGDAPQPNTPGTPGTPGAPEAAQPTTSVRTPAPSAATGCPAQMPNAALLPGTVHNNEVTRDETWTLAGSPHRLPDGVSVQDGAMLIVEPCAVVLVGHGNGLVVKSGGGLLAVGDAAHPIRFGSDNPQPQAGDWQGLWFEERIRTTSRLAHVLVEHGGIEWDGRASCLAVAAEGLHIDHLTARACRGYGLSLTRGGSFAADSSDVTVTNVVAGGAALTGSVWLEYAPAAGSLPTGSYTGNALDEVYIANASAGSDVATIRRSMTWRNLGVPYHVADNADVRVDGPAAPVLTVAPGVTIRFGRASGISVGYDAEGALVMDGASDATRITLRPAGTDESPGQWHGVYFGPRYNRTASKVRFVTIRSAGENWNGQLCDWEGTASDNAFLMLEAAPNAGTFEHITFAGGAPDATAVGRKWNGAAVDFAAPLLGNDFAAFGTGCGQSPVADANGACPDPAPRCQ